MYKTRAPAKGQEPNRNNMEVITNHTVYCITHQILAISTPSGKRPPLHHKKKEKKGEQAG